MSVREVCPANWPDNVRVLYTTREGGCSTGPFRGFNLGDHVGDDPQSVLRNRAELAAQLPPGAQIAWLDQVHGTHIVAARESLEVPSRADGCWTSEAGLACAVMVADCLPVLLTDRSGSVVAAVHAGWRGLAAGVLEAAIVALKVNPQELRVWLGPAIGRDSFEVGPEVRRAFLKDGSASRDGAAIDRCFRPSATRSGHYLADLPALAEQRLRALGVLHIEASGACTVSDPARFFSYRRDATTGRMACLILRK